MEYVKAVYCHPAYLTYIWVKKQHLEWDREQRTDSIVRKEYDKAVSCHLAYLTYT